MGNLAGEIRSTDAQAARLIHRLAGLGTLSEGEGDPEVAPLLPGYPFGQRLMSGLTPIERGGLLDFAIERPAGLDGWTLLFTVHGRGVLVDRPEAPDLREGDVLLIPPHVEHRYRRHDGSAAWWHRWVYFRPRRTWSRWLAWPGAGAAATILAGRDDDFRVELDRLLAEIAAWSIHSDDFATEMAFNLLERAVLICRRYSERPVTDYDPRIAGVCALIAENLERSLDLEAIARHARLSVSRVSHLFQERFGCSIMSWRDDLRMQSACRILRMTDVPIKQVAIRVGYSDPLHFSKTFRKRMGTSPSAYRSRRS